MATVQRIDPLPSGNGQGGFITGAVVLGAVALQFVPGLDIAVDAAAAATGGVPPSRTPQPPPAER